MAWAPNVKFDGPWPIQARAETSFQGSRATVWINDRTVSADHREEWSAFMLDERRTPADPDAEVLFEIVPDHNANPRRRAPRFFTRVAEDTRPGGIVVMGGLPNAGFSFDLGDRLTRPKTWATAGIVAWSWGRQSAARFAELRAASPRDWPVAEPLLAEPGITALRQLRSSLLAAYPDAVWPTGV